MKYIITAPSKGYKREIAGVQFVGGKAETDNKRAAEWFSGRKGFAVETTKNKKGEE